MFLEAARGPGKALASCLLPGGAGTIPGMATGAARRLPGGGTLRAVPAAPPAVPPPTPTDGDLVDAIERGDGSSAGALYDRLFGVVDRTLYRLFGRREADHDDLVQATFEQIVSTLARRKYTRACSLATWASTIATHVGLNALRARRRARRVFDADAAMDAEGDGPASTDGELAVRVQCDIERVRAELATMAPEKAETLLLHEVMGHELAEIAVIMGVSVAAAQSRLVRARKELQDRLADPRSDGRRE
jgi:RNA polymerase sigma-70 factor, ECF subfamily